MLWYSLEVVMLLMSTHNICFLGEIRKIYFTWLKEVFDFLTFVYYFLYFVRNHDTEIYAFGQRFGEEFDENLLKRAFVQRYNLFTQYIGTSL